ncbi:MAG: hypothetical protein SFW62_08665 [Alphaproteobacteria bacterium]|nr:hypothetical protein [Alphaproteobacteria bacterium]
MTQIISVPRRSMRECHEQHLDSVCSPLGKTFAVLRDCEVDLETATKHGCLQPELMIVDIIQLAHLTEAAYFDDAFFSLQKTPLVLICNKPLDIDDLAEFLNLVHQMHSDEQLDPKNFRRLIEASDIARETAGTNLVDQDSFQKALASLSPQRPIEHVSSRLQRIRTGHLHSVPRALSR